MPFYQDADIQPMLDEFGVPVTIGSVTAKCLVVDSDDEIAASASAVLIGRAIILKAKSGTFTVSQGTDVTVDYPAAATAYKAVSVRRDGPVGQLTSIVCARP